MYIDAVTTAALADQFRRQLHEGRVQKVVEIDELTVGMEIYANQERQYLVMTAEPEKPRAMIVPDKVRRGVEQPSPLGLLLRKFIDGAFLKEINQPPWERMLQLDFSSREGDTTLIVEMIDRRANIIMTAEGEILDCINRVGPEQNSRRLILPKHKYVPPPPQEKTMPEEVTEAKIRHYLTITDDTAWRALVNNIAGVSPLFAREIVYRAVGDEEASVGRLNAGDLYTEFRTLLDQIEACEWKPGVVPSKGGGYRAFAAYEITYMDAFEPADSISDAMVTYFGAPVGAEAYDAAKSSVAEQIDNALDKARRKLASLRRQTVSEEEKEKNRKKAELILAYGPTLEPGQETFEAQYEPDGPMYTIEVDPDLPPHKNAQTYFNKYEKVKRAAEEIPKLVTRAYVEVMFLEQMRTDLELAESWPEIDAVKDALQDAGFWRGGGRSTPKGGRPGIRRFTTEDGFVIFVGRNAKQNHELLTERSSGYDLWLHARKIPGSHVIIKNDGRPIPDEVIHTAAQLAAFYSQGQNDTNVDVDITERRYVRPIKGAPPGLVTYKNEDTLTVKPRKSLDV